MAAINFLLSSSILLFCLLCVGGVRVKIHLDHHYKQHYLSLFNSNGSCSDVVPVNRSSLELYGNLSKLGPHVKFWKSDIATSNLAVFEGMKVPGLPNGETVGDVFNVLRKGKCLPFFLGGSVRDQFLNRVPNDADVEVDCSISTLAKLCVKNWGKYNCKYTRGNHVAHIGNDTLDTTSEVMDIGSTNSTFYVPINYLEYTVNAMAYDTNGNGVVIDLTGTGALDTCQHHIRIPSVDDSISSWNLWLRSTHGVLYRFWKLRAKGLVAFNSATQQFIVENAKREMAHSPNSFPEFYCHYVFSSKYDASKKKCIIESTKCKSGLASAAMYNQVLSRDFGEFWTKEIVPHYLPSSEDCNARLLYVSPNHI